MSYLKFSFTLFFLVLTSCASVERHASTQKSTKEPKAPAAKNRTAPVIEQRRIQPIAPTSPAKIEWSEQVRRLEQEGRWREVLILSAEQINTNSPHAKEAKVIAHKAVTNIFAAGFVEAPPAGLPAEVAADWAWSKAQAHLSRGEYSEAEDELENFLELTPLSPNSEQAKSLLTQIENIRKVDTRAVGVILPLSGNNAGIGQKILRGIQIGFGLDQADERGLRLLIRDDEGQPEAAKAAVDQLISSGQVVGIIGSVTSKTAMAVAERASDFKIPVISLAQRQGITDVGPTVFRNSLTAEMQVSRILDYAMGEKKMRRFAILFPNDSYGTEFSNVFWDQVLVRGGEIVAAQVYDPTETDFRKPVRALLGQHRTDMRILEHRERQAELKKQGARKNQRRNQNEDDLPPILNFDAIFIPDSVRALGQISAMLAFNDAGRVTLLGTNLWNQPALSKRVGRWGGEVYFVDSPRLTAENPFHQQYSRLFNEAPGPLEILGFEAGYLMRMSLLSGVRSRSELEQRLKSQTALPLNEFREVVRPLQVLSLAKSGMIEPIRE